MAESCISRPAAAPSANPNPVSPTPGKIKLFAEMGTDEPFIECFSLVGKADFLVTGDKSGLLFLKTHQGTRILTAADFTSQFI
jgi:hypothetical protein